MLPAHPSICLIEHRPQLPLLCGKTRNNREMLKAWRPQGRRRALLSRALLRALLSRSVYQGLLGRMVMVASPKQIHVLTWTRDGAGRMWADFLLSPWWGAGEGRAGGGCVTIVTIELKTLSRISLLTGKGVFLGSKIPAGKLLKETWRWLQRATENPK